MPSRILRLWNPDAGGPGVGAWEEVGDSRLTVHLAAADPHTQYLTAAEGSGQFLPLTGGTLTGALVLQGAAATTNVLQGKLAADTQPRFRSDTSGALEWGVGGGTAPDTRLARSGTGLRLTGNLVPNATNAYLLGEISSPLVWSQVAASRVEVYDASGYLRIGQLGASSAATGAVRLRRGHEIHWRNQADSADLTLAVDTTDRFVFSSDVLVSEATPTLGLKQTADTQPRAQLTDTALAFGPGGATAPDATLSRTGAGALQTNGPLTVDGPALVVGKTGSGTGGHVQIRADDGAEQWRLGLASAAGARDLYLWNARAGYAQRLVVAQTGTLTITPDAAQQALAWGTANRGALTEQGSAAVVSGGGSTLFLGGTTTVAPTADNTLASGWSSNRWTAVYAVAGTINTSSREAKEGITPLDPALALEAVRSTPAVTFTYTAPEKPPEWYDLPDDPEQAQQLLEQRLRAAPLEEAARQQAGFVAEEAHSLFLVGEGQTAASNSVGVLLAALQAVDARVSALEGA